MSSADTDALESWIRKGYGWLDILQAIDTAFAKRRSPPSTVRSVQIFLPKNTLNDELLDPRMLALAFGTPTETPDFAEEAPDSTNDPAAKAKQALTRAAQEATDARAIACYNNLLRDIEEREQSGPIPPETVAILDEALALYGLEALPEDERKRIEAKVDSHEPTMRTRALIEDVGRALDLNYPLLQRNY